MSTLSDSDFEMLSEAIFDERKAQIMKEKHLVLLQSKFLIHFCSSKQKFCEYVSQICCFSKHFSFTITITHQIFFFLSQIHLN